jgi:hypothetical protein
MATAVCEFARRGKLLVGEPFFEGGVPIVVDRKGAGDAAVGDLVVLRVGRGRARLERVLGRAAAIETVLEALRRSLGARSRTASTSAVFSRSRSTRARRRTSTTR